MNCQLSVWLQWIASPFAGLAFLYRLFAMRRQLVLELCGTLVVCIHPP